MPGRLSPPSHTALSTLPVVALDLETTGLDVRRDRVVQVGAIAMLGPKILDRPRLDCLIDPGVPIPETATRIHGLGDADVDGAIGSNSLIAMVGVTLMTKEPDAETQAMIDEIRIPKGDTVLDSTH